MRRGGPTSAPALEDSGERGRSEAHTCCAGPLLVGRLVTHVQHTAGLCTEALEREPEWRRVGLGSSGFRGCDHCSEEVLEAEPGEMTWKRAVPVGDHCQR